MLKSNIKNPTYISCNFPSHAEISSWINQAASGNPWWRPSDVHVSQIHNLDEIKTPAHVVHIPDEKDDKPSTSSKSSEKKQKKKGNKKSSSKIVASSSDPPRQKSSSLSFQEGGGSVVLSVV